MIFHIFICKNDYHITKPDKGSGVVVMDRSDNVRPLKQSSINNETKFRPICGFCFCSVDAPHDMEVDDHSILVSYDLILLFTNVPVDRTIKFWLKRHLRMTGSINCIISTLQNETWYSF